MCGINGFNFKNLNLIKSMNTSIKHRGPDDEGYYLNKNLSLGHTRLSILDLSKAGHQPMFYSKDLGASSERFNSKFVKSSKYSIVYNGEIYNYIELKEVLSNKGYSFSTKTDTEVILAAYDLWGEKCVSKFNGMWAFAIYDFKKEILFCSRDRLGVKPFYYYLKDGVFIFSSELKGIVRHSKLKINRKENLDKESIELYFSLGYIPSPKTIYKNIFKLEASHNLIYSLKKNMVVRNYRYFEIPQYAPINDKKKLIEEGRRILEDAIKIRMRSDVPVGAFLSGGLDSSSVVSLMRKFTKIENLHTFSIGFDGKFDETSYINVAKDYVGSRHHHYMYKEKDFRNFLPQYSKVYDEPFADFSGFPTSKVSQIAKDYVKVVLTGDGGDEIFGGYMSHITGKRMDLLYKSPKLLRKIISKIPAKKDYDNFASLYLLREASRISFEDKSKFYSKALENEGIKPYAYKKLTERNLSYSLEKTDNKLSEALRVYDLLFNTLPDNFLVKTDRASMNFGLELRSPFLDYRFVEFSQKIHTKYKVSLTKSKILMREIIKDLLPKEIVKRGKQGFSPPLKEWINKKEYFKNLENFNDVIKGYVPEIHNFYKNKVFKEQSNLYLVYKIRLYLFGEWYKEWIENCPKYRY